MMIHRRGAECAENFIRVIFFHNLSVLCASAVFFLEIRYAL